MQIDWWTLGLQTVNFLIVVWLLSRLLYQPIKRVINEREAADRKAAELAEEKVRAAEKARNEYEAKRAELAEAQREEETRLHAEMEKEREAMLKAATTRADELVAEARERIARERDEALADLSTRIAGLASDLARKAIGNEALAGEALRAFVTTHLDGQSDADLQELRNDLAGNGNALSIATAASLSEAEQTSWRQALDARFDGAAIRFETDPALLGGIELRFPHALLSFSVADRLKRAVDELSAV